MIKGSVKSTLEAVLRFSVRGPKGQHRQITAVIDTGFSGALTLPLNVIIDLGLPWLQTAEVILGDGSTCESDVYAGFVLWDQKLIGVSVERADTTPLVGMELLHGFRLTMDVERHGEVTIRPLRRRAGN